MRSPLMVGVCVSLLLGGAGCTGDGSPTQPPGPSAPVRIDLVRLPEPGSRQVTYNYSLANALIRVETHQGYIRLDIVGDEEVSGTFQMPKAATRLQPGTYADLNGYGYHDPAKGGLLWGNGCSYATGSFSIARATYAGDTLTALDLSFEQHCQEGFGWRGTIHWTYNDPTLPPGPVNPIPTNLWNPSLGSIPVGNYVYLQSDPGDYIGDGAQAWVYSFAIGFDRGHVGVNIPGSYSEGRFQAMYTLSRLQVGYYPGLQRWPFHNVTKGGLDWSSDGRGCNALKGWFIVDQITYTNDVPTAIDLRFEQHCEGAAPALHGKIHWVR